MSIYTFDSNSIIDYGTKVSRNFSIDCLTCGAYNPRIGRYSPIFASDLSFHEKSHDGIKVIPKWQIANNLANLCEMVLEPLLYVFRSRLIISNAYSSLHRNNSLTDESRHLIGSAVDITFGGSVDDCYKDALVAFEMLKPKGISAFRLVYGVTSWVHIGIEPLHSTGVIGEKDYGFQSFDLVTGEKVSGVKQLRGAWGEDWFLPEPPEENVLPATQRGGAAATRAS